MIWDVTRGGKWRSGGAIRLNKVLGQVKWEIESQFYTVGSVTEILGLQVRRTSINDEKILLLLRP
jgi:hypothetical protein